MNMTENPSVKIINFPIVNFPFICLHVHVFSGVLVTQSLVFCPLLFVCPLIYPFRFLVPPCHIQN